MGSRLAAGEASWPRSEWCRMRQYPRRSLFIGAMGLLLVVLCAAPESSAAQEWDPAAVVAAYSSALNAHDLPTALGLFDDNGSATDKLGHHFEGRAGLTQFLLGSGFGSPEAHITTDTLVVVANRAIWTYSCSCAEGRTDVRLVMMNGNKISVFAMLAAPAQPSRKTDAGVAPWLVGLAGVAGTVAGGLSLSRGRPAAPAPRASQGRLLAGLMRAHVDRLHNAGGADSDRVELPAAAMTSLSDSEDSAGPCSRYRKHEAARPGSR